MEAKILLDLVAMPRCWTANSVKGFTMPLTAVAHKLMVECQVACSVAK